MKTVAAKGVRKGCEGVRKGCEGSAKGEKRMRKDDIRSGLRSEHVRFSHQKSANSQLQILRKVDPFAGFRLRNRYIFAAKGSAKRDPSHS